MKAASAFLASKPTAKDALRWLNIDRPDKDLIRKAYRTLAGTAHPDKGGTTIEMQALNTAKDLLTRWTK
jgi:DnaJ-class molecular chaperone